ncbi:PREDICTED: protein OS-9, partial [Chaetura pelagica]|uniref:protein OS-9 n=1 Tax=Chaetura pelagica TaxID=8897 RepID=UPI000523BDF8
RQAEDVVTVASKFKQLYECHLPPPANPDPEEESRLYNGSGVTELLRPMAAAPCLVKAEDVVTVASKFKQLYECHLPPPATPDPEEESRLYNGSGVTELLRPMAAAPCLVKTKDWWTYEFCYGRHIQQYHMEESEIKGDILFLGYYQSALDWDKEMAEASKQHRLRRYHSQTYVNGSRCDLTGRAREAEVRAEELSPKAVGGQVAGESPPSRVWLGVVAAVSLPFPPSAVTIPIPSPMSLLVTDPRKKIHFKVIRSPGDLLQFIEELRESTKKPPVGEGERQGGEEEEEEEDEDVVGGFEKELESVLLPREQMAQLKDEVKSEMEKEFDNIINEVEDELETEGLKGEVDRTQAPKPIARVPCPCQSPGVPIMLPPSGPTVPTRVTVTAPHGPYSPRGRHSRPGQSTLPPGDSEDPDF